MGDLEYDDSHSGLFDQSRSWDIDIEHFLDEAEEAEWLEEELERIDAELDKRDDLNEKFLSDLEWKIGLYSDQLESLYKRGLGKYSGERERLKDRIEQFYEEIREEKRKHWRDKQQLQEERREVLRELDRINIDYPVES